MPAQANVYTSTDVVDTTPDLMATVAICTVDGVAVNSYGQSVRLIGMVNLTPGADTTAITLELRRNSVTGTQIGTDATFTVTASQATILNCTGTGAEPIGTHSYSICIIQTDASADAEIAAVSLIAVVGN